MKKNEFEGFTCFEFDATVKRSDFNDSHGHLLLESSSSPDYYARNNFPPNEKHVTDKRHLYLLVKDPVICFQDLVFRKTDHLRQDQNLSIKVYPGQIKFHKQLYQCIRINVKDLKELPLVISGLESSGIKFLGDKKTAEDNAHVVYKKYIEFEKLDEEVFRDFHNENRYFFKSPHWIDYDKFMKGMEQIRLSCDYNLFDTFLSYFYLKAELTNFIGIYSKHCDQSRFHELKEEIRKRF
jgi:hypothetical protein